MNTIAMRTDELTSSERNLLTLISQIGFGRLENLELQNGTVVTVPASRRVRTYKPERGHADRKPATGTFMLKDCQAEFLNRLHTVGNGIIRSIVIQDGLPIHFEIEEVLTAI